MVLDNIFLENAQQTKVEGSVINADLQTITIETVQNKPMSLLTVSIAVRKDILQDNVPITRKVCIEKEVHALVVDL